MNDDEIPIYKYSAHRDYTAEGIRLSVHVRGNDLQETANDMEAFYNACKDKLGGDKLAPFKEPRVPKDKQFTEQVVEEASTN